MTETIPSKWMREFLHKHNRSLNDVEKAAVIWNRPDISWNEKLQALEKLEAETGDALLKKQIRERVSYEKECLCRYRVNDQKKSVYLVRDDGRSIYGCFSVYETAHDYAVSYMKKYKEYDLKYFEINKQLVTDFCAYDDYYLTERIIRIDSAGNIIYFFSPDDENFESDGHRRFEDLFFRIPCGMSYCCVRIPEGMMYTEDVRYGVLDSTEKRWEAYMDSLERQDGSSWEFDDIQVPVYYLGADGIWSHKHINPLFLEPEMPVLQENDEAGYAWLAAADALIDFLKEETEERAGEVAGTAKKYAEICRKQKCGEFG